MSAEVVHAAIYNTRTEREVAADTLFLLLVEGIVPKQKQSEATVACGLTFPDMEAARARHRSHGFVAPVGEPTSAAALPETNRWTAAGRKQPRYTEAHVAPGLRRCVGCGETKPETEFPWKDSKRGYRQSRCAPCQNEKARTRYLSVRKTKMLNEVGLTFTVAEADDVTNLACLDCGSPIRPGEEVHGRASLRHVSCPVHA